VLYHWFVYVFLSFKVASFVGLLPVLTACHISSICLLVIVKLHWWIKDLIDWHCYCITTVQKFIRIQTSGVCRAIISESRTTTSVKHAWLLLNFWYTVELYLCIKYHAEIHTTHRRCYRLPGPRLPAEAVPMATNS